MLFMSLIQHPTTSNSKNQSITNTDSYLIDDVLFYNAYND